LNKPKTIGILGGGQLARMSVFAAKRMGFSVAILEKEKNSPAGQLTHLEFKGWVNDNNIMKRFASASDIITLENEFVDYHRIEFLENLGKKVYPSSKTISLIQDKLIQKETLFKNNIPVPKFTAVNHKSDFDKIVKELKLPFILKSRKMGYDGYGNAYVINKDGFEKAFDKLTHRHSKLLAEELINFKMELAVMVVRTKKEIKTYPVVQTIQKNHICHTVIAPARINPKTVKLAKEIALESVLAVKGFGIFGIELFYTSGEKILVNEMAPRPHNSGHYTIEGCCTSQFENHVRSILNLPLGSTEMVKPYAVMINLLGKRNDSGIVRNYNSTLANNKVHLHIYGKHTSRIGRKMGHITVVGDDLNKILRIAKKADRNTII
jgi:5-(carboxyamino)imidazole ribonucleotide synthase